MWCGRGGGGGVPSSAADSGTITRGAGRRLCLLPAELLAIIYKGLHAASKKAQHSVQSKTAKPSAELSINRCLAGALRYTAGAYYSFTTNGNMSHLKGKAHVCTRCTMAVHVTAYRAVCSRVQS